MACGLSPPCGRLLSATKRPLARRRAMREIDAVRDRCAECGAATCVIVRELDLSTPQPAVTAVWAERVPHTRKDCADMVTLMREQWPCLF
jgi:hypothetical protein